MLSIISPSKTLDFIRWLGIEVPRWLENDLKRNKDMLEQSIHHCREIFLETKDFCDRKGIPLGCNIESVAIRRDEVLASFELLKQIRQISS